MPFPCKILFALTFTYISNRANNWKLSYSSVTNMVTPFFLVFWLALQSSFNDRILKEIHWWNLRIRELPEVPNAQRQARIKQTFFDDFHVLYKLTSRFQVRNVQTCESKTCTGGFWSAQWKWWEVPKGVVGLLLTSLVTPWKKQSQVNNHKITITS